MRDLTEPALNQYRLRWHPVDHAIKHPEHEGRFILHLNCDTTKPELRILACSGSGWDHVSVSLEDRCPTWDEMDFVARMFFKQDETAMQLHVPISEHINRHPFVLHLWRPHSRLRRIPRPPAIMV